MRIKTALLVTGVAAVAALAPFIMSPAEAATPGSQCRATAGVLGLPVVSLSGSVDGSGQNCKLLAVSLSALLHISQDVYVPCSGAVIQVAGLTFTGTCP
ncbi:hypothetical protein [Nocardia sp. NPDC046763]|uniref:hypothetical protein n=1 Tax=Nocardia sp. NPDC046763 TaxID=3155256 RepID=UPI0033CEC691